MPRPDRVRAGAGWTLGLLAAGALACAEASPPEAVPSPRAAEEETMKLTSSAFEHEADIPRQYTCDGDDLSPRLTWSEVPEGTASFALIMDDPDAPPGTWVHWVLYDLPGDMRGLPEGVAREERLAGGGTHGTCWGVEQFSRVGYYGPCPPPGGPHRYYFKLYALDARLELEPRATKSEVADAMEGHILAEAALMGRYSR